MEVMLPLWSHVSKRQPTQGRPNVQTTHCKDQNQSIFLLLGQLNCKPLSTGTGRTQIKMSVMILKVALENQNAIRLRQRPPLIDLSQK